MLFVHKNGAAELLISQVEMSIWKKILIQTSWQTSRSKVSNQKLCETLVVFRTSLEFSIRRTLIGVLVASMKISHFGWFAEIVWAVSTSPSLSASVFVIKEQFQFSMEIYAIQFDLCNWIFLLLGFDSKLTAHLRSLQHFIFSPTFWQRLKYRMLLCYGSKSRGQIVSYELYLNRHRVLIPVSVYECVCVCACDTAFPL